MDKEWRNVSIFAGVFLMSIFIVWIIFSSSDNPIITGKVIADNEEVEETNDNFTYDSYQEETEENISEQKDKTQNLNSENIKLANWNLQIFGDTKASNLELMNFYSSVIDDYDIVFVQEIRDADGSSFVSLCSMLQDYNCKVSSRAGRSTSKEQYGVIYRKGIVIKDFKDYNPDSQDRWERPPIEVIFNIGGYELIVYNLHTKPDDVSREMDYLAEIVQTSGNVVVIGDLNADCNYYNNPKEQEFDNWDWLISDNQDTTISSTDCAYDRIILNDDANAEVISYGIYNEGIIKEVSDHYLIWVEFVLKDISIDLEESPVESTSQYTPKPQEEPKQENTGSSTDEYICSSDYYNCGDFTKHSEAKAVFDYCKSQGKGDIHQLDKDDDGNPCESLA